MRQFTDQRDNHTVDEVWWLEHEAVFTQGQAGKSEHLLELSSIPVVQCDRGGQVTYHGPGQLVVYPLLDLRRRQLGVRQMVSLLEQTCIDALASWHIVACAKPDAPGVYVEGRKIASLGLRVRKGCCYHGLSLNVDMDLAPFNQINPCGYAGLAMAQMREFTGPIKVAEVAGVFLEIFQQQLGQIPAVAHN